MIPSFLPKKTALSRKPARWAHYRHHLEVLEDRMLPSLDFLSVDLSGLLNVRVHDLQPACATLPAGDVTLGDVPFAIPATGANTWWGHFAEGFYPRVLDIPVGADGVDEVHTLINSSWGQPGPGTYAALEFHGANGAFYRKDLFGNVDIRDHFYAYWTNFINGTTTTNVALTGTGFLNECRFDKQHIDLPDAFLTETLSFIRVLDNGGFGFQNVMLTGVTVGVRASPDLIAASLTLDTAQGGVNFAYAVAQSPLSQDTTAALYWATGPTLADRIGEPVYEAPIQRALGEHGPFHVPAEVLDSRSGATHLLLVTDPANLIAEANEENNVVALAVPRSDVSLLNATTTDFQTLSLSYAVANWAASAFSFRAYLSSDASFDPGVDQPLAGQLDVTDFGLRQANPDGSARGHSATLTLAARAPVSASQRFVLVVADDGFAVESDGAASRADNALFAVPLVARGERINRVGAQGAGADEKDGVNGSGPFTGAILRGTDDFARLRSLEALWAPNPPHVFGQQDELFAWQREEDTLVQESLLGATEQLVRFLLAERSRLADTWGSTLFSIDEAYDSTGVHGLRSLHSEGRALNLSVNADGAGRLAGLAWLAGFDWVSFDEAGHVHASARASFATTISQLSLQQAVREAYHLGQITTEEVACKLAAKLDSLDLALQRGNLYLAATKLNVFRHALVEQQSRGTVDAAFASQVLQNVDLLLDQIGNQAVQTLYGLTQEWKGHHRRGGK